ncbi:MAG: trans-aconitate methyltransferase [Chloroflexi bacterium RBG_16_68_14]|nr:MAG: trans-aconitate methyltransferase [Chloroflexi bacterium RBG_16_68_14]
MPWDPHRYEQFKAERYVPFEDLVKLVRVRPGLQVIDLGCGTGELTRRLADLLPESDVLGIDSSAEMLAQAAQLARPGLHFEQRTIEEVDGAYDLVFSNAAIQWVRDHESLVPRLLGLVRPGGQLVVQLPSNHAHPTQTTIRELAGEPPFREALGGWSWDWPVLVVEAYAALLYVSGAADMTVFEKVYPHVLDDADALADWMSGTALVPYFERLPDGLRAQFVERYRERLRALYPSRPVFFGFRRILFAATRPA